MFHVFTDQGRTLYESEDVRECDAWLLSKGYKLTGIDWTSSIVPKGSKTVPEAAAIWNGNLDDWRYTDTESLRTLFVRFIRE